MNTELVAPLTKRIAHVWAEMFRSDSLFGPLEKELLACLEGLLRNIEVSAPPGLRDYCCAYSTTVMDSAFEIKPNGFEQALDILFVSLRSVRTGAMTSQTCGEEPSHATSPGQSTVRERLQVIGWDCLLPEWRTVAKVTEYADLIEVVDRDRVLLG